jgi:hypothetical protein
VKALHEQRDELGLAAEMQVLRRRQSSSFKDSRVRDRLASILGTVSNDEVYGRIDVGDCYVVLARGHSPNLRPGTHKRQVIDRFGSDACSLMDESVLSAPNRTELVHLSTVPSNSSTGISREYSALRAPRPVPDIPVRSLAVAMASQPLFADQILSWRIAGMAVQDGGSHTGRPAAGTAGNSLCCEGW